MTRSDAIITSLCVLVVLVVVGFLYFLQGARPPAAPSYEPPVLEPIDLGADALEHELEEKTVEALVEQREAKVEALRANEAAQEVLRRMDNQGPPMPLGRE